MANVASASGLDAAEEGFVAKAKAFLKSPWVIGLMVLGLGYALYTIAPPSEWRDALERAEPAWLLSAVLLVLPHEMLKVFRIEQLLPETKPARVRHSKIVFGMSCVAQLPVGTVGGDVYRVVRLEECGAPAEDATAATFIMRMIGFSSTLIISAVAATLIFGMVWPLLGVLLAAVILFVLANAENPPAFLSRFVDWADRTGSGAWGRFLSATARLFHHVFDEATDVTRMQIARVMGYTLALYAVRAAVVWFCLLAVGLEVGYFGALAALAVGNLASSVPSPAGNVGLREGGMVGVLAGLGVAVAPAAIGALLFRAVVIAGAGLGLLLTTVLDKVIGPPAAVSGDA